MAWRKSTANSRVVEPYRRWPRIGVALIMGLALTIAACGGTTASPTPTPRPTATATPAPCAGWRIVASPNIPGYPESDLRAVSALSPTQAWAVGLGRDGLHSPPVLQSLVEQWDGTAWRIVASAGYDALNGVAALSPHDVWAVGGTLNYGSVGGTPPPERPLILHWDGTTWNVVPSARPAGSNAVELDGVAAIATNDVWAVGRQDAGAAHLLQPLVEHWDGSTSRVVSSPMPPGATNGFFSAVARIPGTNQLWAVGEWSRYSTPSLPQPLIEQWNGAAWRIVTGPALPSGAQGGTWNGVVALSATDAWAVGSYWVKNPVDQYALIGHWDGTTWATVASPAAFGSLRSVAAGGVNDVRAAGHYFTSNDGNGRRLPLIERWNGAAWQIATVPELSGAVLSDLTSITTDGAGNYWAVGSALSTSGSNTTQTLTLHCP